MEVIDATSLATRLNWEAKEYWLHLEAETPLDKYPAKQHAQRVQEKLGVEAGLIYLQGQSAKNNEDSDMPAPFRQRRYFYYLSGCNESNCHLTYDIQHDVLSLFIPRIDEKRVIWNGRGSTLAEALVKYDVDEVYYSDEVPGFIADWFLHSRGCLFTLHDAEGLRPPPRVYPRYAIDTASLLPAMDLARMIKDDHEIQLIQKANDISSAAHRAVLANILKFKNEAQVEGLFLDICISRQAKQQAYDPIAGSGPNAGTLHYDANNEDFGDRQLMCLDAGCEYQLYASDITRTFPLASSWPSKEAENIYKLVERMQESCIKRLAPGVRYLDLHILAHQIAIDGLLALGILHNGSKEEIYKAGTSRAFFPHGLGHHVGLEVHDVGYAELTHLRRGKPVLSQAPSLYPESFHEPVYDSQTCLAPTTPQSSQLEEGMVVTVEPGIYFSAYALNHFYLPSPVHSKYINIEALQHYLPVGGVRIEDDLLITSKGHKNLTSAPKGDAMMSIIRSGRPTAEEDLTPSNQVRRCTDEPLPLLRAPGIPSEEPTSILRPIARAATMPVESERPGSADFEAFSGPSLFTNFRRSLTTDERIRQWQHERNNTLASEAQSRMSRVATSLCGDSTRDVKHIYTTREVDEAPQPRSSPSSRPTVDCSKCVILSEALVRLRKNLTMPERTSPDPGARQSPTKVGSKQRVESNNIVPGTSEQLQPVATDCFIPKMRKCDIPMPPVPIPSSPKNIREPGERDSSLSEHLTFADEARSARELRKQRSKLQDGPKPLQTRDITSLPQAPSVVPTQPTPRNVPTSIEEWRIHQQAQLEKLTRTHRILESSRRERTPAQGDQAIYDQPIDNSKARQILKDLIVQRQHQEKTGRKVSRCTLGAE